LREACAKKPTRGSDSCFIKFKSVGGRSGSFIEALPLGDDGSKIRGSRFYTVLVDELAQMPGTTLDLVLRPMAATTLDPMKRVRRLEEQRRLISLGLAKPEDFDEENVNKMIMVSSGYFKFCHMWPRMLDYWKMIDRAEAEGKESNYAVWQVPYWDLPDGFLEKDTIEESRRVMSNVEFKMEYEAFMASDSEGFFKASLLEECSTNSGHSIEVNGNPEAKYVLGFDPNQGGKGASAGMVIIKIGDLNRIVSVVELKRRTTQQLTLAVLKICDVFNIIRIFMDKGGGGKAICDLLESGFEDYTPIIDRSNKDHIHLDGRHILELINFNPSWISDANFTTKALLEDKKLLFPETPTGATSDVVGKNYINVQTLKTQMFNIVVSQTSTGMLHFDTPVKGQRKDLYSALILAAYGTRLLEKESDAVEDSSNFHGMGGMVRQRNNSSSFAPIRGNIATQHRTDYLSKAVLKKKRQ